MITTKFHNSCFTAHMWVARIEWKDVNRLFECDTITLMSLFQKLLSVLFYTAYDIER